MYRFGNRPAGHGFVDDEQLSVELECHVPPALFSITMPALKPRPLPKLTLHGPHHAAATYCVEPMVIPSRAVTCAEPPPTVLTSKMFCQAPGVFVPATPDVEYQTICPPARRWAEFVRSIAMGEMKRGSGSGGLMKCQLAPPSLDWSAVRPVYSVITLFEFAGSTSV